ncbi:DUF2948 family protein [Bartonella sp. LJL80]
MPLLKLMAMDDEDLEILSAHLQDAVVKVGDLDWRCAEKRFVAALNRFAWEEQLSGGIFSRRKTGERHRTALRFDRVLKVSTRGIDRSKPENVLSLLTVQFQMTHAPAGTVTMIFAGDAAIRLEVECIEAQLTDLGPVWEAKAQPKHK